ncbi:MAG: anthranilate synthase component I [Ignavibacteriae bacterium]|nr:anthranilate synthase component I [Ignavibacteriota bacterium]
MKFAEFEELSKKYNVIPVYEIITADLLTPVLAYLKIREKNNFSFLLESVEGIGRLARYSFIGSSPKEIIQSENNHITITKNGKAEKLEIELLDYLHNLVEKYNHPQIENLPDFTGGIIGYLGFEIISKIESTIHFNQNLSQEFPNSILGLFDTIIAFDHYKHRIILIANVFVEEIQNSYFAYEEAISRISEIKKKIVEPISYQNKFNTISEFEGKINLEEFSSKIEKIKNNIYDGDVFQLVISERFNQKYEGDLINVYRALRIINPSPYMYFMEINEDLTIIGTSPEDLLKVKDGNATILPIAGTRRRGKTKEEDLLLEENLLNDEKEIAEHTMLVDLARNDLGRVCEHNSVFVSEMKKVHRFSHVMHIVSRVEGKLQNDKNCIDALKASFPAGTVSGAPKIRAIQLINEYENVRRGPYAGSVGYIDFNGNLDMCIAIRTFFANKNTIYWQAGAGIVADSKPELELKEIQNKSAVLVSALKFAEEIDENISNR